MYEIEMQTKKKLSRCKDQEQIIALSSISRKSFLGFYKDFINRTCGLVGFVNPTHILQWARAHECTVIVCYL